MARNLAIVMLSMALIGCGTAPRAASIAASAQAQAGKAADSQIVAETYGLISRWLLDRNYMVTSVAQYQQSRAAGKVAVRGTFWSTYRTKRGFLFRTGYWNLSLRDEAGGGGIGGGYDRGYDRGYGGYDRSYGPSYSHYNGGMMYDYFEGVEESIEEGIWDDYDNDYTGDCEGTYGNRSRRNPRRDYNDGLDCYPGSDYNSPGYESGYDPGSPYRSPYNSYNGLSVPLVRITDNSRSRNFKLFNGQPAIAFVDGQRLKEVRLVRDGSAIWKGLF